MKTEIYLVHYLRQSCGLVKIAEYACADRDAAARTESEIRAACPRDTLRFEIRATDGSAATAYADSSTAHLSGLLRMHNAVLKHCPEHKDAARHASEAHAINLELLRRDSDNA